MVTMNSMVVYPVECHWDMIMAEKMAVFGSPVQAGGFFIPNAFSAALIRPIFGWYTKLNSSATTVMDISTGRK